MLILFICYNPLPWIKWENGLLINSGKAIFLSLGKAFLDARSVPHVSDYHSKCQEKVP